MANRDSDYIQFCADVTTELYSAQALLRAVQSNLAESAHHFECERLVDAGLLLPMLDEKNPRRYRQGDRRASGFSAS